jgi:hypothetical protein
MSFCLASDFSRIEELPTPVTLLKCAGGLAEQEIEAEEKKHKQS